MRRLTSVVCIVLLSVGAFAAETAAPPAPKKADDWWNPAWACRKRVRVRLPAMGHLAMPWRPAAEAAQDVVAAQAILRTETKIEAGAPREVRVVDTGGNVLPAAVSGPDTRGLLHVIFPARRTIGGKLAAGITEGAKTVGLDVGRNQAVKVGMTFHILGGHSRIAKLEITEVAAKTSVAKILEAKAPQIAQGTPVRSEAFMTTSARASPSPDPCARRRSATRWS